MNFRKFFVPLAILLPIIGGGFWLWQYQANAINADRTLELSGSIETRQVILAPEVGGQVVEVHVDEGQRVSAGQTVIHLDDATLLTEREQAFAALQAARANLALLESGATPEQVAAAEAHLAQAKANLLLAHSNLSLVTAGSRPEEIAASRINLDRARELYGAMRTVLTSDQIETTRSAMTSAESNLSAAIARRDDLEADSRNPNFAIAAAEAAVADAQAALDIANRAYTTVRDLSQPYFLQIEKARLSWEIAQSNLTQAQARRDGLADEENTTGDAQDAAEDTLDDAREQVEKARAAYEALLSGLSALQLEAAWDEVQRAQDQLADFGKSGSPPSGTAVETLLIQIEVAQAARDIAAANLTALEKGARSGEIDAAQAQVDAAQAQLDMLDIQLAKCKLTAPWDGVVLTRSVEPGETVMPGTTLLEIGRLDQLELTVYLPEKQFGRVTPGLRANVRVDAYPDRVFTGKVMRVADEAEFTPTNIQTKEDRVRLVYAVEIGLDNPDLALKPGMIADVTFES